jgi:DNA (cytosine-5)-methyltransferase 1
MRHGSLFSGIGGFDLASSWMGWENVFNCERNPFCRRVLTHYWPKTKSHEEIKTFNANEYKGQIDVLSGGFPCQPFSQAGKRKGTADDRYLWPQMLRIVGEIHPNWVVGENVFGLLNWNRGMVFRQVLADLETAGYEVWPYVLPAAGVSAPHRRDRIWFVAHARGLSRSKTVDQWKKYKQEGGKDKFAAIADGERKPSSGPQGSVEYANPWKNFPTQSSISGRDDGLPHNLDGITFSSWREQSIKAYGNAIVPQVALQIFKTIERIEALN